MPDTKCSACSKSFNHGSVGPVALTFDQCKLCLSCYRGLMSLILASDEVGRRNLVETTASMVFAQLMSGAGASADISSSLAKTAAETLVDTLRNPS